MLSKLNSVFHGVVEKFIFANLVIAISIHLIKRSHCHIVYLLIVWLCFTLFLGVELGNFFEHAFDLCVAPHAIVVTVDLGEDLVCEGFDLGLIV